MIKSYFYRLEGNVMLKKHWLKLVLTAVGAIGGFAYYYFVGCVSGTCAITSNPYISTAYGAVFGLLISLLLPERKMGEQSVKNNSEGENNNDQENFK